jgi:hypothetical protein
MSNEVALRLKSREGKTLLKTTVRGGVEERTIKRDITGEKRALQIKCEKGKIIYLDCKSCNNEWGEKKDVV